MENVGAIFDAAEFFRKAKTDEANFGRAAMKFAGKFSFLVPGVDVRGYFPVDKAAYGSAPRLVTFRQVRRGKPGGVEGQGLHLRECLANRALRQQSLAPGRIRERKSRETLSLQWRAVAALRLGA
jgi:hypothetical protein